MPLVLTIPLVALAVLAFGCAAYYAIVVYRVMYSAKFVPTARDGLELPPPEGGWPTVTVIIPAHNEADVIAEAAKSLRAQDYPNLRVVFALDRCTDETESVLRDALVDENGELDERFAILLIAECPEGWAGKTNAIWTAVKTSEHARTSDKILFTDADTIFDPGLVRATVALMANRGVGMLSLLSTLTFDTAFERLYQPAAGFELGRQFPLDAVNDPGRKPRHFANGQFMLFDRAAYEAVGGHEAVKDELLEDLAFAVRLAPKHSGHRVGVCLADGMLVCRMYRSHEAFRKGWKRIYIEAAKRKPARLRMHANNLMLTGVALPACALLALVAGVLVRSMDAPLSGALIAGGALGMICMSWALALVYRAQGAPFYLVPIYPLGAWHTASILRESARDLETGVQTEWAGKLYTREARS